MVKARKKEKKAESTKQPDYNRKKLASKFFEEKDKILSSLLPELVNDFKRIGFAKWEGQYQCVLQLGPFDVCPGEVRDSWMKMYHERSKDGRSISRLVYWYGANINQAFSLISKTKISSYDNGVKKGWDRVPKKIEKKLIKQKRLTGKEILLMKNLKAAQSDSLLPPEERSLWLFDFKEDHEESGEETVSDTSENDNEVEDRYDDIKKPIERHSVSSRDDKTLRIPVTSSDDDSCRANCAIENNSKKRKRADLLNSPPSQQNKNDCDEQTKNHTNEICKIDTNDTVDLRILLKPVSEEITKENKRMKTYHLQVQRNGAMVASSDLQISDSGEPVTKKLKVQNITLNLAFKL